MDDRSGGDPGLDVEYLKVVTVEEGACWDDDVLLDLMDDVNGEIYEFHEYFTEGVCEDYGVDDNGDEKYFVAFCGSGPSPIEFQLYTDEECTLDSLVLVE